MFVQLNKSILLVVYTQEWFIKGSVLDFAEQQLSNAELLRSFTDDLLSCTSYPCGKAKYKLLTQAAQAQRLIKEVI